MNLKWMLTLSICDIIMDVCLMIRYGKMDADDNDDDDSRWRSSLNMSFKYHYVSLLSSSMHHHSYKCIFFSFWKKHSWKWNILMSIMFFENFYEKMNQIEFYCIRFFFSISEKKSFLCFLWLDWKHIFLNKTLKYESTPYIWYIQIFSIKFPSFILLWNDHISVIICNEEKIKFWYQSRVD